MGDAMKHWKLWIGISLVFILGCLAGALGAGYYYKSHVQKVFQNPGRRTGIIMERLTRKLDLSDMQKEEVSTIVKKIQERSTDRHKVHREEMRAIFNEGISQIRKSLTPEQQEKLDQFQQKMEEKRKIRDSN